MHKKIILLFLIFLVIIAMPITKIHATELDGTNVDNIEETIIIEDDANLLTAEEKQMLKEQMAPLTEYGNVIFKTTNTENNYSSLKYIQNYYYSKFENEKGVAFYIDMHNRQICACATGGLDKIITSGKCNTIMDNVYKYARGAKYYDCAKETFIQMNKLLSGQKIAETMKYICNAILAFMISLFTSYAIFKIISSNKKSSNKELVNECEVKLDHSNIEIEKIGTHSVYSPRSSSSSSGGSSSRGGGGGFSGSGGSHGF